MNPILEVRNLSLGFRSREGIQPVLNDISFSLLPGETLAVVGESGSGKSVTALSLMRLLASPPAVFSAGQILLNTLNSSVDILILPEAEMRKVRGKRMGMIFQEPMTSLNPVFTCGNQVAEAIMLHQNLGVKAAKAMVLDWFHEVQLPRPEALMQAYPHEISGGQKQRVMIAMAMCNHPEILIADEPTTALDVTVQKTILDLMGRLGEKYKTSMLFISHDLAVVQGIADRILVMYKGEIVESGSPEQIFSAAQHSYTRGLIACRPVPGMYPYRIPTLADFTQEIYRENTGRFRYVSIEERRRAAEIRTHQQPVLKVRDLIVRFAGRTNWLGQSLTFHTAVNKVSFDVFPGEILGLVGESGCGKTSLSRAMLKLIPVFAGSVLYKEKDILNLSTSELRKLRPSMQLVFQDPYSSLNPRLTALDSIQEPVHVHFSSLKKRECRAIAEEIMVQVGLDPVLHGSRYPHEFSGGQRQRICIARALATRPDFLIFDESVSALDVSVQAQILNLLNDLREQYGFACVFISHDLQIIRYMCDRIMVMKEGNIVESGFAEDICTHPEHPYTQSLLEAVPVLIR